MANKMRSGLSTLGIIIGIVVALGESCLLSKDNEGELSEGSKVVFSDEFKKVSFKNEVFYLVNEEEVLALIEE